MKANELRLGNYVHMDMSIDDIEVVRLKIGDLASFAIEARELYPIPLTEEWLLRFGFENNRLGLFDCIKVVEDIGFHIYFIQRHLKEVQYVHQFQNLYFALIGEELKMKEDESKTD